MNITVFLGAPGSGKGTQAKKLAKLDNFQPFSTGDMLRTAIDAGHEVGLRAKTFIDKGDLVPDIVMIQLIEGALRPVKSETNVVLDGFPRTLPQAEALDKKDATTVGLAVFFAIPESILIERLTGRRTCQKCGETFHILFLPPKQDGVCDRCGSSLVQRTDDSLSVVQRRLDVFNRQNGDLLNYYRERRRLGEINADRTVDSIQSDLQRLISKWYR